jgi:hypothetical protein
MSNLSRSRRAAVADWGRRRQSKNAEDDTDSHLHIFLTG